MEVISCPELYELDYDARLPTSILGTPNLGRLLRESSQESTVSLRWRAHFVVIAIYEGSRKAHGVIGLRA